MSMRRQSSPTPVCDSLVPLNDFVALSANVMDAHTAALFVEDHARGGLCMAVSWSLSDHLIHDAVISLQDTVLGTHYRSGQPAAESYFEGDSTRLGMYAQPEPIRAYMTAPVGSRGLLWIDTRQAYRFTGKHLKILCELARTAEDLFHLSGQATALRQAALGAEIMRGILAHCREPADTGEKFLDAAVRMIKEKMGFDAALTAARFPGKDLCRITACCGVPPFIQIGRRVRLRQGWVKWSLDHRQPAMVSAAATGEADLIAFHAGERFGFPVRSLAVIPWRLEEHDRESLLIMASATPGKVVPESKDTHQTLVDLIRLVEAASLRKRLLAGVRRYDAESGVLSEGAFCVESRDMLSHARDKKGTLALVLAEISGMRRMYLECDPATVNHFLEMVTDSLGLLQSRPFVVGKFKTGGFGLLVENAKEQEIRPIFKKAQSLFGTGYMNVGGWQIRYGMSMAVAHFPSDCSDIDALWSTALTRLERPSSALYRWSSVRQLSGGEAGGSSGEFRDSANSIDSL